MTRNIECNDKVYSINPGCNFIFHNIKLSFDG